MWLVDKQILMPHKKVSRDFRENNSYSKTMVENVAESISPVLHANFMIALTPIYKRKKSLNIFKAHYVVAIGILIFYGHNVYFSTKWSIPMKEIYNTGVSYVALVLTTYGGAVSVYLIYFSNLVNSQRFLKLYKRLDNTDKLLEILTIKIPHKKHFQYEVVVVLIIWTILLSRIVFSYLYVINSNHWINVHIFVTFHYVFIVVFLVQMQFTTSIQLILERFRLVNEYLCNIKTTQRDDTDDGKIKIINFLYRNDYNFKKILQKLMQIHSNLMDMAEEINDIFKVQNLCAFGTKFIYIVFGFFLLSLEYLVMHNSISRTIAPITLIVIALSKISFCSITCDKTAREARNTGAQIHKLLVKETNPEIMDKMIAFSKQVINRDLEFPVCGLFHIQTSMVLTVVGTSITFLLVMIQFQYK